jgi:hypothetical protein
MDFKKHLESAWHMTLKHIASLIIMTLVMFILSFVTLGILAPVLMAGYMQAILLMVRDERVPTVQDLFSQMRLFLPLLGFSIVVAVILMVGFLLLFLPGLILSLGLIFACLYMLPLMTDKQLGVIDAVKQSWQMAVKDNATDHIVIVILFVGLMTIGGSVFIGSLFTQPFATVFLISIYLERTQNSPSGKNSVPPIPPVS